MKVQDERETCKQKVRSGISENSRLESFSTILFNKWPHTAPWPLSISSITLISAWVELESFCLFS
jgi:hypothetical protein